MQKTMISIQDVEKVNMRTGKILNIEEVKGSRKLLSFELQCGERKITILSGIKEFYEDYSALKGKHIIFISNLEPRSMMGLISEGMLLTIENSKGMVSLLFSPNEVGDGADVI